MEIINGLISWTHTIAASLSLIFGIIVLFGIKGNAKHRKLGLWYFYAMLINNLTALVIMNAFGKWFFPHYLAIACLIVIIPGIIAIRRKHKHWLKVHIISMVTVYNKQRTNCRNYSCDCTIDIYRSVNLLFKKV
jgi:uncharacterized membrane protein